MFAPGGPTLWELVTEGLSSTQAGYDHLAPRFDATPFRTPDAILERVAAHVAAGARPAVAVDLCCGTGAVVEHIAPLCDQVLGVDFSAGMLAVARERLAPLGARVRFVEADVRTWEPDVEADLVTCSGAFGHFEKDEHPLLLSKVSQILKKGGRFLFVTAPPPRPTSRGYWLGHAFNAVMWVRNVVVKPEFVMVYLNFPLERAVRLCADVGL
jgi:ubiquinone/menaquinone biosynthesis C-methylase UbiE